MSERVATIYYGDEIRDGKPKWVQDTMLPDREGLAWHLRDYDIDLALAIPNANGGFNRIRDPEFDLDQRLAGGHIEQVTAFGLGNAILDRHTNGYGTNHLEHAAPRVNETAVQVFGADKFVAYSEIHGHLPEAIPTYPVADFEEAIEASTDGPFIVKPIKGSLGRDIHSFSSKKTLSEWVANLPPAEHAQYVFQPKYDFTQPIPEITPYSSSDSLNTYAVNNSELAKEVRVYTFHNPKTGVLEFSAVPRYVIPSSNEKPAKDDWFFADPEPLLERLARPAGETAQRLAVAAGVVAVYISVDFGYGARGQQEPNWRLIEANTRFTYLLSSTEHPELGGKLRDQFARHINGVIETAA